LKAISFAYINMSGSRRLNLQLDDFDNERESEPHLSQRPITEIAQLQALIQNLQNQLAITHQQFQQSVHELQQAQQTIATLTATQPQPAQPTPPPVFQSSGSKLKVNPPKEYTGKRENTAHFIAQCKLVFKANPTWTDDEKVVYACTYLRGPAFTWYSNLQDSKYTFPDFANFEAKLTVAFGETDLIVKSKSQLKTLRQTKACTTYATEYNRLINIIGYTDVKANIDRFHEGLKDAVKDLLLTMPLPTTLEQAQANAIACDNRIFQRQQEQKTSRSHNSTYRSPSSNSGPTPMEIDSIRTQSTSKKLSPEEVERRKREGLCVYDGKSDCPGKHDINTCPGVIKRNAQGKGKRPATTSGLNK
jgi:hypothetical protein